MINELAILSETFGADIMQVRQGVGRDQRIGQAYLEAGAGFGGSCLPKDVDALIQTARHADSPTPMLEAVLQVNARHRVLIAERVITLRWRLLVRKTYCPVGVGLQAPHR
ncbi:MAG: hypothetical protein R3C68_01345 [Myxococcota bacterium]